MRSGVILSEAKNLGEYIMNEQELLAFISGIIANGSEQKVQLSLMELRNILERSGVEERLLTIVKDLIDTAREAAVLGASKKGKDVTMEELGKIIREGRERIRREEAFRC